MLSDISVFNSTDSNGNSISVSDSGDLFLQLSSESRARNIGQLVKKRTGKRFHYLKRVKEAHRFRKTDSWGIHWGVLERLDDEAFLGVRTELGTYKIEVKKAKEVGDFLYFKNEGFEKQFFVPVNNWSFERG